MENKLGNALIIKGHKISLLSLTSFLSLFLCYGLTILQMVQDEITVQQEVTFIMALFGAIGLYYLSRSYYNTDLKIERKSKFEVKYDGCLLNSTQIQSYVLMCITLFVLKVTANNQEYGVQAAIWFCFMAGLFLIHGYRFLSSHGVVKADRK